MPARLPACFSLCGCCCGGIRVGLRAASMASPAEVVRAYAIEHGVLGWDAAQVLDPDWLRLVGPAYSRDDPIPAQGALPKHFRFHARRWLCKKLGFVERQRLPEHIEDVIKQRWPEEGGAYTGFQDA